MRQFDKNIGDCPVCNRSYCNDNPKTSHHICPKRYFGGSGGTFELCRNCHNALERKIPYAPKLSKVEYESILQNFLTEHSVDYKRRAS